MRELIGSGTLLILSLCAAPAVSEEANYGNVELMGLSRDVSWPFNPPGEAYAMVCNVNGPDGFLSIREKPDNAAPVARSLKRLSTVKVDTAQRKGNWVRVLDAHRAFTTEGMPLADAKPLPVQGWAHDQYLCDFIDYEEAELPASPQQPTQSAEQNADDPAADLFAALLSTLIEELQQPGSGNAQPAPPSVHAEPSWCFTPETGRYDCDLSIDANGGFVALGEGFADVIFVRADTELWERLAYDPASDSSRQLGLYAPARDGTVCLQDTQFPEAIFCADSPEGNALPAIAYEPSCRDAVQGRLAWNYEDARDWQPQGLDRLCGDAQTSAPAHCFERVMFDGVDWGGGTRWHWENAADLCHATPYPDMPVACFQSVMPQYGWKEAIAQCRL